MFGNDNEYKSVSSKEPNIDKKTLKLFTNKDLFIGLFTT